MSKKNKRLAKSPSLMPGAQMQGISPNAGAMSRTGAPGSVTGNQQPTKYQEMGRQNPPDNISDVNIGNNWFSPFQPIAPFGPPAINTPRLWDYVTGYNLQYMPSRVELFSMLQAMASGWGILRSVIEHRKDQLLRHNWAIQKIGDAKAKDPRIDELMRFFRRPNRKHKFRTWARLLLEDFFVLDAASLYVWHNGAGKPHSIDVVDGSMIFPLIDDAGCRPDYPNPAFQQRVHGLPMINLHEHELIYAPMRPRPSLPVYGYSPVEQIMYEVAQGIRRLLYQCNFWTAGNMPEVIMSVPETWTPPQIASFQSFFDALCAGNQAEKSKVRFVPGGMKPFDIKNANGEALKADIDEWLARIVCFCFSISPEPFVRMMNRATTEESREAAEEAGDEPLKFWFKDEIMDEIIQEHFGYDDLEFVWLPAREVDTQVQAEVHDRLVRSGQMTINEAREQRGQGPLDGGDELLVYTNTGVVRLSDSIAAGSAQLNASPDNPGTKTGDEK